MSSLVGWMPRERLKRAWHRQGGKNCNDGFKCRLLFCRSRSWDQLTVRRARGSSSQTQEFSRWNKPLSLRHPSSIPYPASTLPFPSIQCPSILPFLSIPHPASNPPQTPVQYPSIPHPSSIPLTASIFTPLTIPTPCGRSLPLLFPLFPIPLHSPTAPNISNIDNLFSHNEFWLWIKKCTIFSPKRSKILV